MTADFNDAFHWAFGKGFWYADPVKEVSGLTKDQLYWSPGPRIQCALWHVGHIAHRERFHIKCLLEGQNEEDVMPSNHSVFFDCAYDAKTFRSSWPEPEEIMRWAREVRRESHEFISALTPDQYNVVPSSSFEGNSIARMLMQTIGHTGLHIGRIQLLRMLMQDDHK